MKKPPFYKSLQYALKGILSIIRTERNFQYHLLGLLLNLFLIVVLQLTSTDTALIILACFAVLVTEMLNTAIEKICDFIEPNFNPKIGFIKDLAAGAVLLATIGAIAVGVLVYWRYLY